MIPDEWMKILLNEVRSRVPSDQAVFIAIMPKVGASSDKTSYITDVPMVEAGQLSVARVLRAVANDLHPLS